MNRRLPGSSAIGVAHVLSAVQVTVDVDDAPVSSFRARGVLRVAPVALFQFAFWTTPAISAAPIEVPLPTKSMLTVTGVAAWGDCMTPNRKQVITNANKIAMVDARRAFSSVLLYTRMAGLVA